MLLSQGRRFASPLHTKDESMSRTSLQTSRLIVGIVLVLVAGLLFVFAQGDYSTAGGVALGILGLISIAISRRA